MSYWTVTLLCDDFLQSFYVHLLMCVLYVITCCSLFVQVLYWHLYVPITESAGRVDVLKTTSSVHVHVHHINVYTASRNTPSEPTWMYRFLLCYIADTLCVINLFCSLFFPKEEAMHSSCIIIHAYTMRSRCNFCAWQLVDGSRIIQLFCFLACFLV